MNKFVIVLMISIFSFSKMNSENEKNKVKHIPNIPIPFKVNHDNYLEIENYKTKFLGKYPFNDKYDYVYRFSHFGALRKKMLPPIIIKINNKEDYNYQHDVWSSFIVEIFYAENNRQLSVEESKNFIELLFEEELFDLPEIKRHTVGPVSQTSCDGFAYVFEYWDKEENYTLVRRQSPTGGPVLRVAKHICELIGNPDYLN